MLQPNSAKELNMKLNRRYNVFVDEFSDFRAQHPIGGSAVLFLMNMGIWNIASKFSNDSFLSSFYTHLFMSALFTALFYARKKPKSVKH